MNEMPIVIQKTAVYKRRFKAFVDAVVKRIRRWQPISSGKGHIIKNQILLFVKNTTRASTLGNNVKRSLL